MILEHFLFYPMSENDMKISPGRRIAVIGAGVAGLTAAHLLAQKHRVTLYEKNTALGGHTNTVVLENGPDAGTPIDTGFIVYNDRNYPTFIRLLDKLGIQGQPSDMSFSFSSREHNFEYSSYVPAGLLAQPKNLLNPVFYSMVADILRFNKTAVRDLQANRIGDQTLGDYLRHLRMGDAFLNFYLIPMGAAIWSTPLREMFLFPAKSFLRFFYNHGLLALKGRPQWRTIPGGAHNYVREIRNHFMGEVITGASIELVRRTPESVAVSEKKTGEKTYDFAVIATHADEALALLSDPSPEEKTWLGAWEYTENTAILHTDPSAMPQSRRAWASWNYMLESPIHPDSPVSLTYDMNRLQSLNTEKNYFVSLNRQTSIPDEHIHKVIHYTHPKFTPKSLASQPQLPALNGANRTYYCGSYFGYGFHEDAVKSAAAVAARFGVTL